MPFLATSPSSDERQRLLTNSNLILPPWRESIIPDIRSARSSTGSSSIISTGSWRSMKTVSRRSTATSVRSSRRWWSAISTAAIPSAASPESAVLIVARNIFFTFPVEQGVSAHPVMPNGLRNGVSGFGRSFFWMSLTARSSSSSPGCYGSSSSTSAGFWANSAGRPFRLSSATSRPRPALSFVPGWWPSSRHSDRKSISTPYVELRIKGGS